MTLVLSLFPGIGLLDHAFELEGFCVVRGPDLLWGGDIHDFHPPAGRFDGVIGGPPCQRFSRLAKLNVHVNGPEALAPDLFPELVRVIEEAKPEWWLCENVPDSPEPSVEGYMSHSQILDNRWVGGAQQRRRRWTWGMVPWRYEPLKLHDELVVLEAIDKCPTVTASGTQWASWRPKSVTTRKELLKACTAQGFLPSLLERICHPRNGPFTVTGAYRALGNGVPLPMGRAIARSVRRVLEAK